MNLPTVVTAPRRVAPAAAHVWMVLGLLWASGGALASSPTENSLGLHSRLVASGPATIVELQLAPTRDFDTVRIEAGSGVATLAAQCALDRLAAGRSYLCRVTVTGSPADAAMTLNVIARAPGTGHGLPVTEIHHVSLRNASFARSAASRAPSRHALQSSASPADRR